MRAYLEKVLGLLQTIEDRLHPPCHLDRSYLEVDSRDLISRRHQERAVDANETTLDQNPPCHLHKWSHVKDIPLLFSKTRRARQSLLVVNPVTMEVVWLAMKRREADCRW